jgi:hypothetical protein
LLVEEDYAPVYNPALRGEAYLALCSLLGTCSSASEVAVKCPKCLTFSDAAAKFCPECAALLAVTCVHCGQLPAPATFCAECAQPTGASKSPQSPFGSPKTCAPKDLAKRAQNPVANLVSVPFQNNTNSNVGPDRAFQDILDMRPVMPERTQWDV